MLRMLVFLDDEDGVTAVEYAIMLAFIIIVCIAVIGAIGTQTKELMDPNGELSDALSTSSSPLDR